MSDKKKPQVRALQDVSALGERLSKIEQQHQKRTIPIIRALQSASPLHKDLVKLGKEYQERNRPVILAMQRANEQTQTFGEVVRQTQERLKAFSDGMVKFFNVIQSFGDAIIKVARPMLVISKLSEIQYVFWDYMTPAFADEIISAPDVNTFMNEYESTEDYKKSKEVIEKCSQHPFVAPQKRLFTQAIRCYHDEQYDIAIIGMMAVIDCVITMASGNPSHRLANRCKEIMSKIELNTAVSYAEYAVVTLLMTYQAMFDTLEHGITFSDTPNAKNEPMTLNRHWLMHGRTVREKTRFDCIKLLNFLYSIILIDELSSTETLLDSAAEEVDSK